MNSKSKNKNHLEITDDNFDCEEHLNLKSLLISFSQFSSIKSTNYIYNGNKKIPFKKRHLEYQAIFKKEFAKAIRF